MGRLVDASSLEITAEGTRAQANHGLEPMGAVAEPVAPAARPSSYSHSCSAAAF